MFNFCLSKNVLTKISQASNYEKRKKSKDLPLPHLWSILTKISHKTTINQVCYFHTSLVLWCYLWTIVMMYVLIITFKRQVIILKICIWIKIITQINKMKLIKSNVGKSRAWIRNSLNEKDFSSYILSILKEKSLLKRHYESYSLMLDSERVNFLSFSLFKILNISLNIYYVYV